MDDSRTDLEKATAQVAGLERFLRSRLLNTMTRLVIALVLIGGLISANTSGSHFLETVSVCLLVTAAFATWFIAHYFRSWFSHRPRGHGRSTPQKARDQECGFR
jgi:hypothetical protein